ncbi:uncharacterized protein LOC113146891 [Cyclospora cayetanensis]|uniref:Uncharacterized protein LOC113146891 n=1 Tax=Cyclospora cayetanensis TaxID=88456 RepID=A0A6P6RU71_9EIME|nr:uncharacterized protein LOC113146891 [Cyclospora cayetanensis]
MLSRDLKSQKPCSVSKAVPSLGSSRRSGGKIASATASSAKRPVRGIPQCRAPAAHEEEAGVRTPEPMAPRVAGRGGASAASAKTGGAKSTAAFGVPSDREGGLMYDAAAAAAALAAGVSCGEAIHSGVFHTACKQEGAASFSMRGVPAAAHAVQVYRRVASLSMEGAPLTIAAAFVVAAAPRCGLLGSDAAAAAAVGCLMPDEAELELASQLAAHEKAALHQLFKEVDLDGDGRISAKDIAKAMAAEGISVPIKELQQCVWEADTDGDGYLDLLDLFCLYSRGKTLGVLREAQLVQHFVLYLLMKSRETPKGVVRFEDALMYLCQVMHTDAALKNLEKIFGSRATPSLNANAWLSVLGSALWAEASPVVDKDQQNRERYKCIQRPFQPNYRPKSQVDTVLDLQKLVSLWSMMGAYFAVEPAPRAGFFSHQKTPGQAP